MSNLSNNNTNNVSRDLKVFALPLKPTKHVVRYLVTNIPIGNGISALLCFRFSALALLCHLYPVAFLSLSCERWKRDV